MRDYVKFLRIALVAVILSFRSEPEARMPRK